MAYLPHHSEVAVAALLEDAGIDRASTPEGFAPWQLLEDLGQAKEKHLIWEILNQPPARKGDLTSLRSLKGAAERLRKSLDELSPTCRERLDLGIYGIEKPLADLLSSIAPAEEKLEDLIEGGPTFDDNISGRDWLIGHGLPGVFEKHFQRRCGIGIEEVNDRPTEGIRFIRAAMRSLELDIPSAAGVKQASHRARRLHRG